MNKEQEGQKDQKDIEKKDTKKASDCQKSYLLVLVILIVIAVAVAGYYSQQTINQKIDNIEVNVDRFSAKINSLQRRNDRFQDVLQDLREETEKSDLAEEKIWQPIVIEHLIRMAELTLNTSGDVRKAILFLQAAKKNAKGAEFSAVNRAIGNDIVSLQAFPAVDYSSVILKIRALGQRLDALPMTADRFVKEKKEKVLDEKSSNKVIGKLWTRLLVSAKDALKNVVEIHRGSTTPLPLPGQEEVLRLNMKINLLQAELAVIEHRNELYQSCLREVETMVKRYFSLNKKGSSDIIYYIKNLEKINLQPQGGSSISSISVIRRLIEVNISGAPKGKSKEVVPLPKMLQLQETRKI